MEYGKRIETITEIKKIQLDILKAFHHFCVENDINYSLAYGSLLGAVRHKGFIPWDDDIDICLLRKDYQKLEVLFPKLLLGKYTFISLKRDNKWIKPYGIIYDSRTIEIEEASNCYKGVGVGIDIFPIDPVCDSEIDFSKFQNKRKILVNALNVKYLKWRKERALIKNLSMVILKVFFSPFSVHFLSQKIDSLSRSFDIEKTNYLYHSSDTAISPFKRFPKSIFDSYIDVEFEGNLMKAMRGYDTYLSNIYGDYMTPPPVSKRVSTHIFEAYWK